MIEITLIFILLFFIELSLIAENILLKIENQKLKNEGKNGK